MSQEFSISSDKMQITWRTRWVPKAKIKTGQNAAEGIIQIHFAGDKFTKIFFEQMTPGYQNEDNFIDIVLKCGESPAVCVERNIAVLQSIRFDRISDHIWSTRHVNHVLQHYHHLEEFVGHDPAHWSDKRSTCLSILYNWIHTGNSSYTLLGEYANLLGRALHLRGSQSHNPPKTGEKEACVVISYDVVLFHGFVSL